MSHTNPYLPGCAQCGITTIDLVAKCTTCQVASYCNAKCKALNASEHRPGCRAVARARAKCERVSEKYRREPEYSFLVNLSELDDVDPNVFQSPPVLEFVKARTALANALQCVQTRQAAEERLHQLHDILLLTGGVARDHHTSVILGLCLRMGRDKECYQFIASLIKRDSFRPIWWRPMEQYEGRDEFFESVFEHQDKPRKVDEEQKINPSSLRPIRPETMDPLNDMAVLDAHSSRNDPWRSYPNQLMNMALALIKFRILQDLKNYSLMVEDSGSTASLEALDLFLNCRLSSDLTVCLMKNMKSEEDLRKAIKTLTDHIEILCAMVGLPTWRFFFDLEYPKQRRYREFSEFDRVCMLDAFTETYGAEKYFRKQLPKRRTPSGGTAQPRMMLTDRGGYHEWVIQDR